MRQPPKKNGLRPEEEAERDCLTHHHGMGENILYHGGGEKNMQYYGGVFNIYKVTRTRTTGIPTVSIIQD